MKGDIRLIADHPAIVTGGAGRNIKESAGAEFVDAAVVQCSSGATGDHQPNMLDVAARGTDTWSDMNGPSPTRLVRGATNCQVPDSDDFEFSFFEYPYLVGFFKSFQDYFEHFWNLPHPSFAQGNEASLV
jgi:hypothetical protein